MSIVTLVSGGLDSTLLAILAKEEGLVQAPLFIDYGQLGMQREFAACEANFRKHNLPQPTVASLKGFGQLLPSGLTDSTRDIFVDAFLPCRNLMFLVVGAAYAYRHGYDAVGIGLLDEAYSLFADQRRDFIAQTQVLVSKALSRPITIKTPLMSFSKADVVAVAREKGIANTYSCHAGTDPPCGRCVACREYFGLEV